MTFYEDAAFLSSCAAFAARVRTLPDRLYCYRPRPKGNLASGSGSRRHWRYKFLSLAARKRLARATGGAVWPYCAASCVFSLLEMARLWRSAGLARREAWRDFKIYLSDPDVGCALRRFPLSWRHPAVAAALCALRLLRRRVVAKTGSPDASGAPAGLSDEPAADLGDAPQGKAEEG
jgi:hypothetical protein